MSHVYAYASFAWDFVLRYPGPSLFVFGLVVTALLRKRSAEEFAAMPPRRAAAIRFFQGIFPDAPKIIETVGLFVTGRVPAPVPPTPPSVDAPSPKKPPTVPPLPLLLVLLALSGCAASHAAEYSKDLAACEALSSSCQAYVECRAKAAAKADRPFTGYCATDGGAK